MRWLLFIPLFFSSKHFLFPPFPPFLPQTWLFLPSLGKWRLCVAIRGISISIGWKILEERELGEIKIRVARHYFGRSSTGGGHNLQALMSIKTVVMPPGWRNLVFTANIYRDIWGFYRESGVHGFTFTGVYLV